MIFEPWKPLIFVLASRWTIIVLNFQHNHNPMSKFFIIMISSKWPVIILSPHEQCSFQDYHTHDLSRKSGWIQSSSLIKHWLLFPIKDQHESITKPLIYQWIPIIDNWFTMKSPMIHDEIPLIHHVFAMFSPFFTVKSWFLHVFTMEISESLPGLVPRPSAPTASHGVPRWRCQGAERRARVPARRGVVGLGDPAAGPRSDSAAESEKI